MDITEEQEIEIAKQFNKKAKKGIEAIEAICTEQNLKPEEEIAKFFHKQKNNLDLEAVGDYLGDGEDKNQNVLKNFTKEIDFEGQSFTEGMRGFLKTFKLPGEAQKIDRLVESFGEKYSAQNPDLELTQTTAYVLSFATIMLSTDSHNPSIKDENKMTEEQFKNNLRGANKENDKDPDKDFDPKLLSGIYNDIKKQEFEFNFAKESPGYTLSSQELKSDATFKDLDKLLKSSEPSKENVQEIFSEIKGDVSAKVSKPKSLLNKLTGYEGTITLTDNKTNEEVTIEVRKPNIISSRLFGEKPTVIIKPSGDNKSFDLAAKATASFSSHVTSIKATYEYDKNDLEKAYKTHRVDKQKDTNIKKAIDGISKSVEKHVPSKGSSAGNAGLPNNSSTSKDIER